MTPELFKYGLMLTYAIATLWLSWQGMKRTKDIKGFSVGNGDMSPVIVGITLAASISSTATFVINPGFVYQDGLAAYMHYGVAGSAGLLCALLTLSRGFLKLGTKDNGTALTIPDWIYKRYQQRSLSLFFACINLLSITFIVLILVGCSILMAGLFGIPEKVALVLVLVFVFSYVLMGGTYAHAYTNTMQGFMMILLSLFLFAQGLKYFDGGFINTLTSISENYASLTNPDSALYFNTFSVFISGFVITFALMLQPHILTKVLYLKSEKDLNKFIATSFIVWVIFTLMLFLGFYAKLSGLENVAQDAVTTQYLLQEFTSTSGQYLVALIFVTMLAAGMSTLDGILVSLSAMVVNDIYRPLAGDKWSNEKGLQLSRITLVIIGIIACAVAWNPPALAAIFAQKGVYGLAAASVVPIAFGVFWKKELPIWVVWIAAATALTVHLFLNLSGIVLNPAVSSTWAIFASVGLTLLILGVRQICTGNHIQSSGSGRN